MTVHWVKAGVAVADRNVRSQEQSGNHMLALSFPVLTPERTLGLAFRSGSSLCLAHRSRRRCDWRMPICHRAFNERGESGIRNILKPATSGNPSAASADTKARTAAGTSPLINRLIAFV